jgi:hypothetical protein
MTRRPLASLRIARLFAPLALTAAVGLAAPSVSAQPPPGAPVDPVVQVARQRFEDGVKAYQAGKWKDARDAFLQAYALKRSPAVLLNLGQSEIKAGFYEDGGNHLTQFLREHQAITLEQRTAAEAGINDAKKKTGYVILSVDANGADVSVDGVAHWAKTPILDPYFVKPGKHTVVATFGGKSTTTTFDAKVGAAAAAMLTLGVAGVAPPPPPIGTQPQPIGAQPQPIGTQPIGQPIGAQPQPYPPQPYQPQPGYQQPGYQPQPVGGPSQPVPPAAESSQGGLGLVDWYTKKPVAWVGTGLTGVGLILGVVGSAVAANNASKANGDAKVIADKATSDGLTRSPCGPVGDPSQDVAGYAQACGVLRQDIRDRDAALAAGVTGWVVMGLGVIGTVTYVMVDWYPQRKKSAAAPSSRRGAGAFDLKLDAVSPYVLPDGGGGLGLGGRF